VSIYRAPLPFKTISFANKSIKSSVFARRNPFRPSKYFPSFVWFFGAVFLFGQYETPAAFELVAFFLWLLIDSREFLKWVSVPWTCFLGSVLCFWCLMLFLWFIFSHFQFPSCWVMMANVLWSFCLCFGVCAAAWLNIFKGGILKISHE